MQVEGRPVGIGRFRITIGRAMLAIPVFALLLTFAAGINPFRRDPYPEALRRAVDWCSNSSDTFGPDGHFDFSMPTPTYIQDEQGPVELACVVKIAFVKPGMSNGRHYCDEERRSVAQNGRSRWFRSHRRGSSGGDVGVTPAELAALTRRIAALPPPQGGIARGNSIAVGLSQGGKWVTRVYDRSRLPSEFAALTEKMGMAF